MLSNKIPLVYNEAAKQVLLELEKWGFTIDRPVTVSDLEAALAGAIYAVVSGNTVVSVVPPATPDNFTTKEEWERIARYSNEHSADRPYRKEGPDGWEDDLVNQ